MDIMVSPTISVGTGIPIVAMNAVTPVAGATVGVASPCQPSGGVPPATVSAAGSPTSVLGDPAAVMAAARLAVGVAGGEGDIAVASAVRLQGNYEWQDEFKAWGGAKVNAMAQDLGLKTEEGQAAFRAILEKEGIVTTSDLARALLAGKFEELARHYENFGKVGPYGQRGLAENLRYQLERGYVVTPEEAKAMAARRISQKFIGAAGTHPKPQRASAQALANAILSSRGGELVLIDGGTDSGFVGAAHKGAFQARDGGADVKVIGVMPVAGLHWPFKDEHLSPTVISGSLWGDETAAMQDVANAATSSESVLWGGAPATYGEIIAAAEAGETIDVVVGTGNIADLVYQVVEKGVDTWSSVPQEVPASSSPGEKETVMKSVVVMTDGKAKLWSIPKGEYIDINKGKDIVAALRAYKGSFRYFTITDPESVEEAKRVGEQIAAARAGRG